MDLLSEDSNTYDEEESNNGMTVVYVVPNSPASSSTSATSNSNSSSSHSDNNNNNDSSNNNNTSRSPSYHKSRRHKASTTTPVVVVSKNSSHRLKGKKLKDKKNHKNYNYYHSFADSSFGQRLGQYANNALVGIFIIASIVSNVRAITVAIVSNCWAKQRFFGKQRPPQQQQQQQQHHYSIYPSHSKKNLTTMHTTVQHFFAWQTIANILLSLTILLTLPMILWMGSLPTAAETSWYVFLRQAEIGWVALLHVSIWPLVVVTLTRAVYIAHQSNHHNHSSYARWCSDESQPTKSGNNGINMALLKSFFYIVLGFFACTIVGSQLQIIAPSWLWNPFIWGQFKVFYPSYLSQHLKGICVDYDPTNPLETRQPLCLSRYSWKSLSAETLDPTSPRDVEAVVKGIHYAREQSGGLIVNIMSRDTVDAIEPLRENVESLLPFFPDGKLAVVIFENDSKDGSREGFKEWAKQARGYTVDLMSCGADNPDCKFGLSHRYDATESKEYFKSSAIGKMADFRQRMVDYITQAPQYTNYSHMLVMDLDLQVSISPLGLIHSLGTVPDSAVASTGRQVWPGSLGTLVPPYDFSAFRALETPNNHKLLSLHDRFCALMPAGDRWRNQCDAVSPMQLTLVLGQDWLQTDEPYQVKSAFNGATLYPLQLIKETHAKYDSGDDGQRCEHIGFNQGLGKPMYVNPKWNFHIAPENPGGPTGYRALRNVMRIMMTPRLGLTIGAQIWISLGAFVYALLMLGLHVLYPLLALLGVLGHRRRLGSWDSSSCLPLTSTTTSTPATISTSSSSTNKPTDVVAGENDYFDFRMLPLLQPSSFLSKQRAVKHV